MNKNIVLTVILGLIVQVIMAQSETPKTALILIDLQNFYFPGGKVELVEPVKAAEKAKEILNFFRENEWPVIHVKHQFEPGGDINALVQPQEGEKVIVKQEVNAFNGTPLNEYLKELGIKQVVIVGMQTHMCVEGATRGAYDLGYKVVVVDDACATRNLTYSDIEVTASQVHASTLLTLKSYAKIFKAEEFLKMFPF